MTDPHKDPDRLRAAYENADTVAEAVEEFDAPYRRVHENLVKQGIHEPDENLNRQKYVAQLEKLRPEDVGLTPLGERRTGGESDGV